MKGDVSRRGVTRDTGVHPGVAGSEIPRHIDMKALMTIFISDLADMMSSCAVVISPLSMMMETPGLGPRNEMRLLL